MPEQKQQQNESIRQPASERDPSLGNGVTVRGRREQQPGRFFPGASGDGRLSRADFFEKLNGTGHESGDDLEGDEAAGAEADADELLGEALSQSDQDAGHESGKEEAGGDAGKPPKTLADVAERLGLEVKDLYKIEVPHPETGKPMSIGAMKDLVSKEVDFEARSSEFEERRTKAENELLRAKQDLQVIVQSLPKGAVKPEVIERARKEAKLYRDQEAERLAEALPDWLDESVEEKERNEIFKHLEEYGFSQSQFDAIIDHRLLKYMRDNWQRAERVAKALAKVKEKHGGKKQRSASRPAARRQAAPIKSGGKSTLRQRIAELNTAAMREG